MKRRYLLVALALLCVHLAGAQQAADYLAGAHLLGTASHIEIEAELEIALANGVQRRTIQVFLEREEDHSSLFAQVLAPAFLRNMKFLVTQESNGREDTWLKTSHGVRRIADTDRETQIFNSHFTTEDFSFVDVDSLRLRVLSRTTPPGRISIEAIDPSGDGGARRFVVDESSGLIREVAYYDAGGAVVRRYAVLETTVEDGETVPQRARMTDVTTGESTTVTFTHFEIMSHIPARMFNRGNL